MHVLLFDIDGTLLSAGGAGQAAMEDALERIFGVRSPVHGISTAGRTDRAITRDLFEFYKLSHTPDVVSQFLTAYLDELPRHLAGRSGLILPGVPELLDHLRQRDDVILGLLTGNFEQGAKAKLGHFGLDTHFTFGGFGDHHEDRNDVARWALAELQQRHPHLCGDHVWVLGDTPADIRCARAIGARVLAVATGVYTLAELSEFQPDLLLPNLAETKSVLQQMGLLAP